MHPSIFRIARGLLLGGTFALLAGCCVKPGGLTPMGPPPPPITLDEQVARLTRWSRQLPLLRATTVLAGVRFEYTDEKGQGHSQTAEGTLVIRQHLAEAAGARTPPDVLLLGKAFDQPAFEAGRNATTWWFILFLDQHTAWVGDATRPVNLSAFAHPQSSAILRADLVPDLLGLSALPTPDMPANDDQWLLMRVNDLDATNDLFIEQLSPEGRPFLAREIIVDRFTGNVKEVRIYNPAGVLVVRSQLAQYAPVSYADEAQKATSSAAPQFPKHVTVTYPAQQTTITLEFDEVSVRAAIPDAAFTTPDFQRRNLKVIPVD